MYHVATLFPEDEKDEQCIEKKRFFGNDVVVLIFQEPGTKIDVSIFSTHFTQAYIIVEPVITKDNVVNEYIIATANKTIVPPYGPYIPDPPIIPKEEVRDFILTKLINAERASMRAHTFRLKMERTRSVILSDEFKPFVKKGKSTMKLKRNVQKKNKTLPQTKDTNTPPSPYPLLRSNSNINNEVSNQSTLIRSYSNTKNDHFKKKIFLS